MSLLLKLAFFILISSFFIVLPEFNLIYAQSQTQPCSSFGITSQVLNQPNPIPEGLSSLQIKLSGLREDGYYSVRIGTPFDPREFWSDTQQRKSNGEVILTITDSNILNPRKYDATLEYSFDGTSARRNPNYCSLDNIYTIGGTGNCYIVTTPDTLQTNQEFNITIGGGLMGSYYVFDSDNTSGNIITRIEANSQGIGISPQPIFFSNPGQYNLYLFRIAVSAPGGKRGGTEQISTPSLCSITKHITPPAQPGNMGVIGCNLIPTDPTNPSKEYKVSVFNLKAEKNIPAGATNKTYTIILKQTGALDKNTDIKSLPITEDSFEASLGNITLDGNYSFAVNGLGGEVCSVNFTVIAGAVPPGAGIAPPPPTACADPTKCTLAGGSSCNDPNDPSRGPGFKTAIGCVHTSPIEFTKDAMAFLLGIGGGLAFLMMILGAFQMLTSAGNPETLQTGRERLQSAVIGLLFVIFATLLLQIIGFDILRLPGFGR